MPKYVLRRWLGSYYGYLRDDGSTDTSDPNEAGQWAYPIASAMVQAEWYSVYTLINLRTAISEYNMQAY